MCAQHTFATRLTPFISIYEVSTTYDKTQIATTAAVNIIYIAQMAMSFRNPQIMETAVVMYSRVAGAIGRKLAKMVNDPRAGSLDDFFGGVHVLITCGLFSGLSISFRGRKCHVKGVENITGLIANERITLLVREAFTHK